MQQLLTLKLISMRQSNKEVE